MQMHEFERQQELDEAASLKRSWAIGRAAQAEREAPARRARADAIRAEAKQRWETNRKARADAERDKARARWEANEARKAEEAKRLQQWAGKLVNETKREVEANRTAQLQRRGALPAAKQSSLIK